MKEYSDFRLVKSADLNHHGTLFAGRTAEWFVESSFVAAACTINSPESIVCVNIHGLQFKSSVSKGDVICFRSRVARVGTTSIIVHTVVHSETTDVLPVEGYVTFVCVDADGKKRPHGIIMDKPENEEEARIREQSKLL